MRSRQPRILVSRRTTWERLTHEIASHDGSPVAVVGRGARARKLILRMFKELPPENELEIFTNDHDWVAVVNPDGPLHWDPPAGRYTAPLQCVAWRRDPAKFRRDSARLNRAT